MASDSRQPGSTIQTVTSADGTSITFERHGRGPPLVLLHGSSGTRRSWDALRPHLTDSFTLYVPDRRGRGDSGDADAYALAREAADLRAIVERVDGEPTVFGHSFGGLITLAAGSTERNADLPCRSFTATASANPPAPSSRGPRAVLSPRRPRTEYQP